MRKNRLIWLAMTSLLLSSMACSLMPFGNQEAPTATAFPPTAKPVALPTEAPGDKASDGQSRENFEIAPLSKEALWNEDALTSLRSEFVVNYDMQVEGEPMQMSMTMLLEATTDPPASHIVMTQSGLDLGDLGGFSLEMYTFEDEIYLTGLFGDEWMLISDEESDFMQDILADPQTFVEVPPQAWRAPNPETVNGVSTWHYTFTDEDLQTLAPEEIEDLEYEALNVDMWVAVDGGYMVRMEATMTGVNPAVGEDSSIPMGEVGSMHMTYNLLEINTDFTLELPPEAANAEPFDPFDMLGEMDEGGEQMQEVVPLPDDAQITFSLADILEAETTWGFDQTKDWMLGELQAQGWAISDELGSASDGYIIFLDLGEQSLMLILTESESGTTITATLE